MFDDTKTIKSTTVQKKKKRYQKPTIQLEESMTFALAGIRWFRPGVICRQCSTCHGCR